MHNLIILMALSFNVMAKAPSYSQYKEIEFRCDYLNNQDFKKCISLAENCFSVLTSQTKLKDSTIIELCIEIIDDE